MRINPEHFATFIKRLKDAECATRGAISAAAQAGAQDTDTFKRLCEISDELEELLNRVEPPVLS